MWNLFQSNPGYRANIKGLFHSGQVRGQAWILRTLADATYITPDNDILKKQFETFLLDNIDWYILNYTKGTSTGNALGWIVGWIEENQHPYFFVLNLEGPNNLDMIPIRMNILKGILKEQGFFEGKR